MLRTSIARLGTAAMITSLLVVGPTGSAEARDFKPWGKAVSKDHVLKRGCHDYSYRYKVRVPTEEWQVEIFFISPDGTGLAHAVFDSNAHPAKGREKFTVCRPSTEVGKHKIKMKVTTAEGETIRKGWVKPTRFRFTAR
ncbi:hypothetical protein [Nocardioides sp.]|uniref:hypothetical protein n=1 Tax=Nocardioides sp. TaxID=35761 RepID=UPI002B271886|nr:hypothetical protein [Nocardioides sp.]